MGKQDLNDFVFLDTKETEKTKIEKTENKEFIIEVTQTEEDKITDQNIKKKNNKKRNIVILSCFAIILLISIIFMNDDVKETIIESLNINGIFDSLEILSDVDVVYINKINENVSVKQFKVRGNFEINDDIVKIYKDSDSVDEAKIKYYSILDPETEIEYKTNVSEIAFDNEIFKLKIDYIIKDGQAKVLGWQEDENNNKTTDETIKIYPTIVLKDSVFIQVDSKKSKTCYLLDLTTNTISSYFSNYGNVTVLSKNSKCDKVIFCTENNDGKKWYFWDITENIFTNISGAVNSTNITNCIFTDNDTLLYTDFTKKFDDGDDEDPVITYTGYTLDLISLKKTQLFKCSELDSKITFNSFVMISDKYTAMNNSSGNYLLNNKTAEKFLLPACDEINLKNSAINSDSSMIMVTKSSYENNAMMIFDIDNNTDLTVARRDFESFESCKYYWLNDKSFIVLSEDSDVNNFYVYVL